MVNPRQHVIQKLKKVKFVERIGGDLFFLSVAEAVDACLALKLGR